MTRAIVTMLLLRLLPSTTAPANAAPAFDAATAANATALDLYRDLRAEGENLFFSPASLACALAMTSAGARGRTAAEMDDVLHQPADDEVVAAAYGRLLADLMAQRSGVTLALANRLYGQRDVAFLPAFTSLLGRHYGAGLETVDFRTDPDAARRLINTWVEERTAHKIRDLLPPGAVTTTTGLVLVNAVHFLGKWAEPFPARSTADAPFHRERGGDVTAKFMHANEHFAYAETADAQVLALPYSGGGLEMVLVLPASGTPLSALESGLDADRLAAWLAGLAPAQVDVTLPRLHLETTFELADALARLGMPTAFTPAADFTGMAPADEPLCISRVVHKAYLDVDEAGTEAAAATGVAMERLSASIDFGTPKVFRADRPFVLAIRHRDSGAVLFLGRVADPTSPDRG